MGNKVKVKESGGSAGVSTERAQRKGRQNYSTLSSKHQVTIPVDVMREAGFSVGDVIVFSVEEGSIVLKTRKQELMEWIAGFEGIYDGYDFAAERADAWPD
jgi:bifunctional DNA-binding transcriptional regulator/antitoxin component of YhaV-PrlF toxin-antitoxin module